MGSVHMILKTNSSIISNVGRYSLDEEKCSLYLSWSASSRALLLRLLFENIQSKMHLACSGGTAEAGGGEGAGWTDRWQRSDGELRGVRTADQVAPSRQTSWVGGGGDITHMT